MYFYYLGSFSEPLAAPSALLAIFFPPTQRAGTTFYPLPPPLSVLKHNQMKQKRAKLRDEITIRDG